MHFLLFGELVWLLSAHKHIDQMAMTSSALKGYFFSGTVEWESEVFEAILPIFEPWFYHLLNRVHCGKCDEVICASHSSFLEGALGLLWGFVKLIHVNYLE